VHGAADVGRGGTITDFNDGGAIPGQLNEGDFRSVIHDDLLEVKRVSEVYHRWPKRVQRSFTSYITEIW
jgi:hypothetical protein